MLGASVGNLLARCFRRHWSSQFDIKQKKKKNNSKMNMKMNMINELSSPKTPLLVAHLYNLNHKF